MNPYDQMNPALLWLFEHPGVGLSFTIFWMFWIAVVLTIICMQLRRINEREELKKIMLQFDEERREREKKASRLKSELPANPDKNYMPKG
jgi:hypothetical protein